MLITMKNGLLIGRFQPFHLGHLHVLHYPLRSVDNLWIGIGSSNKSNEKENPFSVDERREMITSSLLEDSEILDLELQSDGSLKDDDWTIKIFNIPDVDNHKKWVLHVDSIVPKYDLVFTNDEFTQILFERHKSKVIPVPLKEREKFSGTNIRQLIVDDKNWQDLVPKGAQKVLDKINAEKRLKNL